MYVKHRIEVIRARESNILDYIFKIVWLNRNQKGIPDTIIIKLFFTTRNVRDIRLVYSEQQRTSDNSACLQSRFASPCDWDIQQETCGIRWVQLNSYCQRWWREHIHLQESQQSNFLDHHSQEHKCHDGLRVLVLVHRNIGELLQGAGRGVCEG